MLRSTCSQATAERLRCIKECKFSFGNLERKGQVLKSSRSGFVEDGRVRRYNWDDGKWLDLVLMVILEEDWEKQRGV